MELIRHIPILTTILSLVFFVIIFRHWLNKKQALYLFGWSLGVLFYGAGTLTESLVTLNGWDVITFKAWYITGAFLGGVALAQGTVYLLFSKRVANVLSAILISVLVVSSVLVILSPIKFEMVEEHRLTGSVLEWQFIRGITPFVNIYAFIFLVGGAIYSAWYYYKKRKNFERVTGNSLIALGGLLPGIGGSFTKFGYTEVLYVTEFLGLILIFWGYLIMRGTNVETIHENQKL